MRVIIAACAVLVLCASVNALAGKDLRHKLRAKQQHLKAEAEGGAKKWDIYGDYHAKGLSGKCKDKLHEQIASEALDHLAARRQGPLYTTAGKVYGSNPVTVNDAWRGNELKTGVRWNDMPTGNRNDFLNLADFAHDFEAHVETDVVSASHYGCLQHIHGMAPVVQGAAHPVLFTNQEVLNLISSQMEFWWNKALDALFFLPNGAGPGTTGAFAPKAKTYSHYIGHILHTFGDAYAPAHVVRGWMTSWNGAAHNDGVVPNLPAAGTVGNLETLVPACGKVITFQGYGAQDGELHGETDHSTDGRCQAHDGCKKRPDNRVRERLVECSTAANYQILDAFTDCIQAHAQNELGQRGPYTVNLRAGNVCSFAAKLAPIIRDHFVLSNGAALAGGSVRSFVPPNRRNDAAYHDTEISYVDVVGDVRKAADDHVLVPVVGGPQNAVLWSAQPGYPQANAVKLCTNVQARTGWKASVKQPFTEYANVDNTGHDHIAHIARTDGLQI